MQYSVVNEKYENLKCRSVAGSPISVTEELVDYKVPDSRSYEAVITRITDDLFFGLRDHAANKNKALLKITLRNSIDTLEDLYKRI